VAAELLWPEPGHDRSVSARTRRIVETLRHGYSTVETALDPSGS
jgi:hypothetical protein